MIVRYYHVIIYYSVLLYADDMVLIDSSLPNLKERLECLVKELKNHDLFINPDKCGIMGINELSRNEINKENGLVINMDENITIEPVSSYIYLGIKLNTGFSR